MPDTASRPIMYIHGQSGRDQVALACADDWSAFERPLPTIFHRCASHWPGLVVDVGANTGFYTVLAGLSSRTGKIIAFEPDVQVAPALRANVAANGLTDRVTISSAAVSERSGQTSLYIPTQEHGLVETSSSLEPLFKTAHSETRDVDTITLDAFFGQLKFRFRRVSIIKIDVEGHEVAVLKGSLRLIRRWRPIIFIEILPIGTRDYFSEFLRDHDYIDVPLECRNLALHRSLCVETDAWNHAFIPAQAAGMFTDLVANT